MRFVGTILLIVAVALFGTGRVSVFSGHHSGSVHAFHSSVIDISTSSDGGNLDQLVATLASDLHAQDETTGSSGDTKCSSNCCTFACHLAAIEFRELVRGPDFSFDRITPEPTAVLFGRQPIGLDRPPRAA
jgi:hypothetical protein